MNIKGTHVVPFFIPLEDMTNFAVYTKNGCPYCSKIMQILDAKGFTYQEYKLDVDFWLSLGTPKELHLAEYWFDYFSNRK